MVHHGLQLFVAQQVGGQVEPCDVGLIDPGNTSNGHEQDSRQCAPRSSLMKILRLEVSVGEALNVGSVPQERRRIVSLTGGTFTGPELNERLLPGVGADWQIALPDGTMLETSATHCRPMMVTCCMFARKECATEDLRFSLDSVAVWRSMRVNMCSARQRRSRRRCPISIG